MCTRIKQKYVQKAKSKTGGFCFPEPAKPERSRQTLPKDVKNGLCDCIFVENNKKQEKTLVFF